MAANLLILESAGMSVSGPDERTIRAWIRELDGEVASTIMLRAANESRYITAFGGRDDCFVAFVKERDEYWIAEDPARSDAEVEFVVGGECERWPEKQWIGREAVANAFAYYAQHLARSPAIAWERWRRPV